MGGVRLSAGLTPEATMARACSKFVWTAGLAVCAVLPVSSQPRDPSQLGPSGALTCDAAQINPDSYALTTRVQASIVTEDRSRWWERFSIVKGADDLRDLNWGSLFAAERAVELDPQNLLAHALLARQDVLLGLNASRAEAEWRAVLDNGGAVVWTATLYDVDVKSYFIVAFDRLALRVYRFGELAHPFDTHLGMPKFPGPDRERLWRAWAGCVDAKARPEASVPWSDVREIKAGNWVLEFKLAQKIIVGSDGGKRKDLDVIKMNLHGGTPTLETHVSRDPIDPWNIDVRTMGIGPLAYQERVRRTLVKFVDPDGRIALPKASRFAGW
jgi:hypothetical protein